MLARKKTNGFKNETVTVSKNSLTVSYKDFKFDQLEIGIPIPGTSKTDPNVKFHTCPISYRYDKGVDVNDKPIFESGPFKLTGPKDWMWDGVSSFEMEFEDKKTGLKAKKITKSIGFSIDLSNEEHIKFYECICTIYKRIVWAANIGPQNNVFKSNVGDINGQQRDKEEFERVSDIKPWAMCRHLLKVKSIDVNGRPQLDKSYKPRFYSTYVESGMRKTKIVGYDETTNSLREFADELVENLSYYGTPCWVFNDWYIGSKPKVRHAVTSIYVDNVELKAGSFDQNIDMEEEKRRRQDTGLASLSTVLSTMMGERDQEDGEPAEDNEYSKSNHTNNTPPTTTTNSSSEDYLPSGGILA